MEKMGIDSKHLAAKRRVGAHVDTPFAQVERAAAADEAVGLVEGEDRPRKAIMAEQLSGSLLRREQGSIEEYMAAPRSSAPAASALATASCSAWCVGDVSWV